MSAFYPIFFTVHNQAYDFSCPLQETNEHFNIILRRPSWVPIHVVLFAGKDFTWKTYKKIHEVWVKGGEIQGYKPGKKSDLKLSYCIIPRNYYQKIHTNFHLLCWFIFIAQAAPFLCIILRVHNRQSTHTALCFSVVANLLTRNDIAGL